MGVSAPAALLSPRRATGPLADADGRVVLLLALLFGLLVWRAGLVANVLYAGFFVAVLASAGATAADARQLARWAASFALVWGGVKLAVDLLGGVAPREAGAAVALLAVRLVVLLLLGGAVSALLSPRALGLALAGLTPPVLRGRAWKVSLALLLMVHFVPRALGAFEGARAALRVRRVALPRLAGLVVVLEAGARNLARLTWDQALAVAARRLDAPEAWADPAPLRLAHWGAGVVLASLAGAAAVLL
jgi:biotin transport system permease protein